MKPNPRRLIYWGTGDKQIIFDLTTVGKHNSRVIISANTRTALAKVLIKFRAARRAIGTSSMSLMSDFYSIGSLRWIACHSGKIIDVEKQKIVKFKNPNLRKIMHFLDTV